MLISRNSVVGISPALLLIKKWLTIISLLIVLLKGIHSLHEIMGNQFYEFVIGWISVANAFTIRGQQPFNCWLISFRPPICLISFSVNCFHFQSPIRKQFLNAFLFQRWTEGTVNQKHYSFYPVWEQLLIKLYTDHVKILFFSLSFFFYSLS